MPAKNLIKDVKWFVASIAWKVFIWCIGMSEEEYWQIIYEQEKRFLEAHNRANGIRY